MTDTEQAPAGLDLDRMVDDFDAFDHDTAQHLFEVINHARARCPVSRSTAYGGYWLVTGYAEVRHALSDPGTYPSNQRVGFPHHQSLMMPPIDLDPPPQKEFRRSPGSRTSSWPREPCWKTRPGPDPGWISLPVTFRRR
jgi:cytochrome P450